MHSLLVCLQNIIPVVAVFQGIYCCQKSRLEGIVPNTSRPEAVYGHSLIINPSVVMYQEIHPYSAVNIDSIIITTCLIRMREWILSA